ncbi:cation:proton antiporter [Natranaerofaba carboxydovora]|uniref:cation:proton antiporter n=1 Tax=Natranaerofaba carboxydovora TaxID=2742683 RepID=UPI0030B81EB2
MLVFGELFLAISIGIVAGVIISFLAPRTNNNAKILVALIGIIALSTGIAETFQLSPILLNMTTGVTITNLSTMRNKIFKVLEGIELPVLVAFLTLAGAKLNISLIPDVGLIGVGYIFARSIGKIIGARVGCRLAGFEKCYRENLGFSLIPQAGVAIGLSVIAEQKLDMDVGVVTTVILAAVIVFEVIGPLLVKFALQNTGEVEGETQESENSEKMED